MFATFSQGYAGVLTFDDVPGGSTQNNFGDMPTYQGFNFSSTLDWIDTNNSTFWNFGAHSGDFSILNNNGGVGTITAVGNIDFTFDGLWAKRWATPPNSGGASSLLGVLQGYNNGVQVWSVNTALNGSFQFFGPQAGAIDELRLGFGNVFMVDDLILNAPQTVPEPGSFVIWGVGAVGIAVFASRRNKQRAA